MKTNLTKHLLLYMYENDVHPDFTVLNHFFIKNGIDEAKAKTILNELEEQGIIFALKDSGYDLLGVQIKGIVKYTFQTTQIQAYLKLKGGVDYVYTTYIMQRETIKWGTIAALAGAAIGAIATLL